MVLSLYSLRSSRNKEHAEQERWNRRAFLRFHTWKWWQMMTLEVLKRYRDKRTQREQWRTYRKLLTGHCQRLFIYYDERFITIRFNAITGMTTVLAVHFVLTGLIEMTWYIGYSASVLCTVIWKRYPEDVVHETRGMLLQAMTRFFTVT